MPQFWRTYEANYSFKVQELASKDSLRLFSLFSSSSYNVVFGWNYLIAGAAFCPCDTSQFTGRQLVADHSPGWVIDDYDKIGWDSSEAVVSGRI